jgi:IS5 family transposase
MKLEVVVERSGVPVGVVTDAADTAEAKLAAPALATIPEGVAVGWGVPVVADRGYDSDPLRDRLWADGYRLLAPHRRNRKRPRRNDGRRMRRYRRRFLVERTNAWLHSYRRVVVRYEWWSFLYHGFVHLACAFIALGRL